tara:strand:+ start:104 stop:364 length:261 start_codon:yes stop_codon:yes gene_type:complete
MPSTKYFNKYRVISTRDEYPIDKRYKSMKAICDDLADSPLNINSRISIYNIINNNVKYKYRDIKIEKIREPLPFKTITTRVLIEGH